MIHGLRFTHCEEPEIQLEYPDILEHPHDDYDTIIAKLPELEFTITDKTPVEQVFERLRQIGEIAALFTVQVTAADIEYYEDIPQGSPLHLKSAGEWCNYDPLSAQALATMAWPGGSIRGIDLLRVILDDHPQRWYYDFVDMD